MDFFVRLAESVCGCTAMCTQDTGQSSVCQASICTKYESGFKQMKVDGGRASGR